MVFYDADGQELRHRRVVGYLNPERFLAHVDQAIGARP